jgi:hypothetical protein
MSSESEMWAKARSFVSTTDKTTAISICGVLAAIPCFSLILVLFKGEPVTGGFLVYSSLSLVFLVFGLFFYVDTSELLVADVGLARRIGDRICMQIAWNQIRCVRETFRPKARNGSQIIIQVIPKFRRSAMLRLRRILVISEQFENFNELIEIINAKIEQHSIRVEVSSNGQWAQRSKLRTTL